MIDDWLRSVAREDLGYRVLATDLSADALETARAGQYSRRAVAGIPGDLRERYFTAQGDGHRVRPALAERVRFQRHDLTEQPFPGGIDLVFCRNVLIYFRRSTREAVARRLSTSLALHGFLFLGEGEALQPCPEAFQMLRTPDGLIYQRTSAVIEGPRREGPAPEPEPPLPTTPDPHVVRLQGSYEEGAEQRLAGELRGSLEKSRPLVVVDLDGATYLADGCAHLLQRLASNLEQGRLVLVASRPGVVRWISRHADQLEGIPHRRTVAEAGDRSDR